MKRLIKWIILLVVILFIVWKVQDVMSNDTEVPDPELLAKKGVCLGLNYHRIKTPNVWNKAVEMVSKSDNLTKYYVYEDEFEEQINWMKQPNVHFATAEELAGYVRGNPTPDNSVWLSFDDVDHTVYENAYPILKEAASTVHIICHHGSCRRTFSKFRTLDME